MVRFIVNGAPVEAEGGGSLLSWLREVAHLTAAKNACGEGVCGACSVLVDGALLTSCTLPMERMAGRNIVTVEGIPRPELDLYANAFADSGAVQCGFCTPGMVLAAKALLDRNPRPTEAETRAALRRNICRCTGYAKIVQGILLAAARKRGEGDTESTGRPTAASAAGIGARLRRVDAVAKARGEAA